MGLNTSWRVRERVHRTLLAVPLLAVQHEGRAKVGRWL